MLIEKLIRWCYVLVLVGQSTLFANSSNTSHVFQTDLSFLSQQKHLSKTPKNLLQSEVVFTIALEDNEEESLVSEKKFRDFSSFLCVDTSPQHFFHFRHPKTNLLEERLIRSRVSLYIFYRVFRI